ncbi:hypothetical protein [Bradyrhizobium sp. SZCCHNR3117]|uniref:hypothetical protein n=1 Tax=Bradyrhizobium sp. SZCCHNR3117 TaxID=3057467 RepID=UPI0028E3F094|nr:hypothetical protein [Bradyrhizobium sp. SZCCHNR3117]
MQRPILQLNCITCGGGFAAVKPPRGRYPRFCSQACRKARQAAQHVGYRADGRCAGRNPPVPESKRYRKLLGKVCEICANPFTTTNARTRCCGITCGQILQHRLAAATRSARALERNARICVHCGKPFQARSPSAAARAGKVRANIFCSRQCVVDARLAPTTPDLFAEVPCCR